MRFAPMPKRKPETEAGRKGRVERINQQIEEFLRDEQAKRAKIF